MRWRAGFGLVAVPALVIWMPSVGGATTRTGPSGVTATGYAVPLTVLACVFLVVGAALVFAGNAVARRRR
jgi:hypothetical protein